MQTMHDETARIRKHRSAQEQLRQITQDVQRLTTCSTTSAPPYADSPSGCRSDQREALRQIQQRLDGLAGQLMSRQIELRQLRALAETTALINSSLDTDSVLNQVMDTVIQLTGAERGYIMLTNKATGSLEFRIARGIDREQLARDEFIVSNTIVNEVFQQRRACPD